MTRRDNVAPSTAMETFLRDEFRCVAPRLDPECGPCSDELTIEHVRSAAATGGKRAPSKTPEFLVTLCTSHTEPGMKAGRVWNLSHKPLLRAYLRSVNGDQAGRAAA